jgi:hypothetical protein
MNLQLTEVLTDVMGMTGQAIVRAIVAGERDPKVLARHRNGRVKASAADIQGNRIKRPAFQALEPDSVDRIRP